MPAVVSMLDRFIELWAGKGDSRELEALERKTEEVRAIRDAKIDYKARLQERYDRRLENLDAEIEALDNQEYELEEKRWAILDATRPA